MAEGEAPPEGALGFAEKEPVVSRPVGSTESTESILRREAIQWSKRARRIGALLDKQIDEFEKRLDAKDLNLEGQLQVVGSLCSLLERSIKTLESSQKYLTSGSTGTTTVEEDTESVKEELLR